MKKMVRMLYSKLPSLISIWNSETLSVPTPPQIHELELNNKDGVEIVELTDAFKKKIINRINWS